MRISLFYELQVPRPWDEHSEQRVFNNALEQIELADKLGFNTMWQVEHHFLEEYSHSSAPEVFLGAVSQRTKDIRIGHGIANILPKFTPPARLVARINTLDILSNGRVEFGTGESTSNAELMGFGQDREDKHEIYLEMLKEIPRMMVESPYSGHESELFTLPVRNIVPKPLQKPHPPIWSACTRNLGRVEEAGRLGLGALTFGLVGMEQANTFVDAYYAALASDEAELCAFAPNPNIAFTSGFHCAKTDEEALARGLTGMDWFAYSIGHYGLFGAHRPGETNVQAEFEANRAAYGLLSGVDADVKPVHIEGLGHQDLSAQSAMLRSGIGSPETLREYLLKWEATGADELILINEAGNIKHEDICESLELFGKEVLPEFKDRDEKQQAEKQKRLEPVVERLLETGMREREASIVIPSGLETQAPSGAPAAGSSSRKVVG